MEESKYYAPSLEEIFVGLKCQGKWFTREESGWRDTVVDIHNINIFVNNPETTIRVKYLDREDIRELGCEQISYDCFNLDIGTFRGRPNQELRILVTNEGYVSIYLALDMELDGKDNIVLFNGVIKNKSELKRILKQIGV